MPTKNKERKMRIAQRRVKGFTQQFGEAHRNLARHAAFPLVLTPDLLYQIWANFVPEAPWTAVARVLLSRLCRQVGYEMYEMDIADRNLLLRELNEEFGQEKFDELGEFLLDYVSQRLTDDDADTRDLREAQEWTALAYTKPGEAARELAKKLRSRVTQKNITELFRLTSLVTTLTEPLAEAGFEPLLSYSLGIESFAHENLEDAVEKLGDMLQENSVEVAGVSLVIPEQVKAFWRKNYSKESEQSKVEQENISSVAFKEQAQASCVRLVPSAKRGKVTPELLIIDPEIAIAWGEVPQNILVYEDQTLASLDIDDLRTRRIIWRHVEWREPKDLFFPDLTFIDLPDALPGAIFPNGTKINFNGQEVTVLIPLHPILLKYLTPEDLIKRVEFKSTNSGDGPVVRVTVDLPLSGVKNNHNNHRQSQNYRIYKDYHLNEENALREVPVLELWPHFRVEGWKEYYAFYYDGEFGEETFQVDLPDAQEPHIFQDGLGSYQIARLEEFPSHIVCQDNARNPVGLILLKTPEKVQPKRTWRVGVDFGTSFTNVYINQNGAVEPLPMQNLHLKVTDVQADTRNPVLFEYFIPESFIPADKPLPLSSLLTKRGSRYGVNLGEERPIYDGRIYIPDLSQFQPEKKEWIETGTKMRFQSSNFIVWRRLFLKNLALIITANAAEQGVSQINWSLSYPSAFSNNDKTRYAQTWKDIVVELRAKTGIRHFSPELDDLENFRAESLAFAQYFAEQEDYQLVNATCINLGDNTSDISVWQDNNLIHQCSIQLAGRHLFSQLLELNPKFLEQRLEIKQANWQGLEQESFNAKLDVFMRWESEKWLKNKRVFVEGEQDFQGLLRLMAIGFAGLYYYVGTILGVLYEEKKYTIREITPVYMGGNGSRLLHWLAIGGRFDRHSDVNQLLSLMLSRGSGFDDTEEITSLSTRPKDEVACGLLRRGTKLKGLGRKIKDPIISGEDCEVNDQPISWKDRLELEGKIDKFHVPEEMEQLKNFLDLFNLALEKLEIDGLTPIPGYEPNQISEVANQRLWRDTYKELQRVTLEIKGHAKDIRVEPAFILGLKALMRVLGKEWAGK